MLFGREMVAQQRGRDKANSKEGGVGEARNAMVGVGRCGVEVGLVWVLGCKLEGSKCTCQRKRLAEVRPSRNRADLAT